MNDRHTYLLLRTAARACGVATSYLNYKEEQVAIPPKTLVAMINALQNVVVLPEEPSIEDLQHLVQQLREKRKDYALPHIVSMWEGVLPSFWVWLEDDVSSEMILAFTSEEGRVFEYTAFVKNIIERKEGKRVCLGCNVKLPFGYYTLEIKSGRNIKGPSFVIAAPRKIQNKAREWGVFGPAYALRSQKDWGIGGIGELKSASEFIRQKGGSFFGTLPLLAGFMEGESIQESPYAPVSRLFWNEIFLDMGDLPGQKDNVIDPQLLEEIRKVQAEEYVDYKHVYELKKQYLLRAAHHFFDKQNEVEDDFKEFITSSPYIDAYAKFRSQEWPENEREQGEKFHLYVQYTAYYQLSQFKEKAQNGEGAELYLDYPIGIHPNGFDAQHFSHLFLNGFHVGAPPDMFFSRGQDWGFQPFHPRRFEEDHFAYFRATLHNYFRYARMIRLDHIMGLYRIYCIPEGHTPKDGAYIYYPFQAFLAVLCLEAYRHQGVLIGEDLGTVPDKVREAMEEHGINRMWIFQFDVQENIKESFSTIAPDMIANFNTHDLFPFKAYMESTDLEILEELGLLDPEAKKGLSDEREKILKNWKQEENPFNCALKNIAHSNAHYIMVNMEDVWQETQPQNIPGTINQYPNWRKKFKYPIEVWSEREDVCQTLDTLNQCRKASI